MAKTRLFVLLSTFLVLLLFGGIAVFYARGYRLEKETLTLSPRGLLVINSDPNGAQVFVDNELKTATNNTITLLPGTYDISVQKDGYLSWNKRITIAQEVVTQVNAFLLPSAPSLSAFTFSGAVNPQISPDLTRIAYAVPLESGNNEKAGLWVTETGNLPLGFNREPRRITDGDMSSASWQWSPDSREILLITKNGAFLLDVSSFTAQNQRVNISSKLSETLRLWDEESAKRRDATLASLKDEIENIFKVRAKDIIFSPDETKIIYAASESAKIPEGIVKPLPGASTQKQEREIKPGSKYVYDIKEDRNFLIGAENDIIYWLPNSMNLLMPGNESIVVSDYDGTNRQVVFFGRYSYPNAFPSPGIDRILLLTNFGANGSVDNLYWLSLK